MYLFHEFAKSGFWDSLDSIIKSTNNKRRSGKRSPDTSFKGGIFVKNKENEKFKVTEGYLLVMEAIRRREEAKKYIWDIEDDGYYFEEA